MSEKRERICPVCGRSYTDPPALSRRDNKTDICPECGMREALAAIPRRETPAERTRRAVYATGNKWAIENFEATHSYYEKLPEEVARRLTEIDTEAVEHITRATGLNLSGSLLDRFGEKLASDAAFAQVIRAANVYRGRLGYAPLGPDGWPEVET